MSESLSSTDDTLADAEPAEAEELFPLLYTELRRLARSRLAAGGRHALLDTNSLLHDSYLKLQGAGKMRFQGREHFLAYAATTMRSVVIDFLRQRSAEKHGGGIEHITLDTEGGEELGASDDEILEVHNALEALARIDHRLVRIVEMRYFVGLSEEEIAAALNIAPRTVNRNWQRARLLLAGLLGR